MCHPCVDEDNQKEQYYKYQCITYNGKKYEQTGTTQTIQHYRS